MNQISKVFLVACAALLFTVGTAKAQAVSSADVQLQSLTVSRVLTGFPVFRLSYKLKATVYSYWDDDAGNTRLQILLPPGLKVTSLPANCSAYPFPAYADGSHGGVSCKLGSIAVRETQTVDNILVEPIYPRLDHRIVGAFGWSSAPDPLPGNNYKEVTLP